jgi:predicted ATPase/transcriptional regulator with XRE-family HTH domain
MRQSVPAAADENALPWNRILRALRDAAGVTQDGWAARLGYGRRTIQRWERGETAPDARAAGELLRLCGELHLFRSYQRGALASMTVTAALLQTLLADARTGWPGGEIASGEMSLRPISGIHLPFEPPHNLPADLASFVGRAAALAEIGQLLGSARLITLSGTGGVGKTRLALRVATDHVRSFPDGVWLVQLAAIDAPALALNAVTEAVGVRGQRGQALEESLVRTLQPQRALLLLDNCEHLLGACATLIAHLLRSCPALRVLATSREPLGVPGEIVWQVPPLSLPESELSELQNSPATLMEAEAVRLFVERARLVSPSFALTTRNAPHVVDICRSLDGIPLAIELAAAWPRFFSVSELSERLDDRFRLLARSANSTEARHQTLRAAVDWSYDLLAPPEQQLFDRLSIFVGPFSLSAAEEVCTGEGVDDVLMLLARLVEKSLVLSGAAKDGDETRFHMLETLRVYAGDRLRDRGERSAMRRRQTERIVALAERARGAIHGPNQGDWLRWIERDRANVRAALDWAIEEENAEAALRIVVAIWWPWGVHGRGAEACSMLERALALPESHSTANLPLRASALASLGMAFVVQGNPTAARPSLAEAEQLSLEPEDEAALLTTRAARSLMAVFAGSADAADEVSAALALAQKIGASWFEVRLIEMQANLALRQGDTRLAASLLEAGTRIAREAGDAWGLAQVLGNLGDLARSQGAADEAKACYEESESLRASIGILERAPSARQNLAFLALDDGDTGSVRQRFVAALDDFRRRNDRRGMTECLIGLACVSAISGQSATAARLFGAGDAALKAIGSQIWPSNQAVYERELAKTRADLSAGDFEVAYTAGQAMSVEEGIAFALEPPSIIDYKLSASGVGQGVSSE